MRSARSLAFLVVAWVCALVACSHRSSSGTEPLAEEYLAAAGGAAGAAGAPAAECQVNGDCGVCEVCTPGGDCVQAAPTTPCGDQTNDACKNPDRCDFNGVCQPRDESPGTACGDQIDNGCKHPNTCDASGICQSNDAPVGTACGDQLDDECKNPGSCDANLNCASNDEPVGAACGDQTDDACKNPGTCDANGVCQSNDEPANVPCDDGIRCTIDEHCDGFGSCLKGTPQQDLCRPAVCDTDLTAPQCCAFWSCDLNDTDPVTEGCVPHAAGAVGNVVCRPSAGVCDVAEQCPANGFDCPQNVFRGVETTCQAAVCGPDQSGDGALAQPARSCTGVSKDCPVTAPVACVDFACNAAGTACRTACSRNAHCLSGSYCDEASNECRPRTDVGKPCEGDAECAVGSDCVDGVCCDSGCSGQCEACNLPGHVGFCQPFSGDPSEHDRAPCGDDGSVCGGSCNGALRTRCQYPTTDRACADAACDPGTNLAVDTSYCDGRGACHAEPALACAPYLCVGDACGDDCAVDAECREGTYCRSGRCVPQRAVGEECSRNGQCEGALCVDNVCCATDCSGQCEACNLPGSLGVCVAVTGAPVGGRAACAGSGVCAGSCDGTDRDTCAYPGRDSACQGPSCGANGAVLPAACDGRGECPRPDPVPCANGCEGNVCAGDACVLDADCGDPAKYCAAGSCVARGAPGDACADGRACASGFCVDGVCCNQACLGQCEACDVRGDEGSCVPVPAGGEPRGARSACSSDGSDCGGNCDGRNGDSCAYPTARCRDASCDALGAGNVAIVEARCDGMGHCPARQEQSCGGAACSVDGERCDGACAGDPTACGTGEYCSAGICVEKRGDGQACGADAECASEFCTDGYCCGSSCDGTCEACDVPGALGQCRPIEGTPHAGRAACPGVGPCAARCDGSSRESCVFAAVGTSCGAGYCGDGVRSSGQLCDGAGSCEPEALTACPSFQCDGLACANVCSSDADCTGDLVCAGGSCSASDRIDAKDVGTCGCRVPGAPGRDRAAPVLVLLLLLSFGARSRFRRGRSLGQR